MEDICDLHAGREVIPPYFVLICFVLFVFICFVFIFFFSVVLFCFNLFCFNLFCFNSINLPCLSTCNVYKHTVCMNKPRLSTRRVGQVLVRFVTFFFLPVLSVLCFQFCTFFFFVRFCFDFFVLSVFVFLFCFVLFRFGFPGLSVFVL